MNVIISFSAIIFGHLFSLFSIIYLWRETKLNEIWKYIISILVLVNYMIIFFAYWPR